MVAFRRRLLGGLCAVTLASCGAGPPGGSAPDASPKPDAVAATEASPPEAFVWPSGLNAFGAGFPNAGDPCRRLGESAATINYLDDSAILVGCPGAATDAAAVAITRLGGKVVGGAEAVTFISIPQGDANVGMRDTGSGER